MKPFIDQASTFAPEVDLISLALCGVTLFFLVIIVLGIGILAIYYRKRPGNEVAREVHESLLLELSWSVLPVLIGVGLFVWGAVVYLKLIDPPKDAIEIAVVGKQWMWKFQHPNGRREINDLHVPKGKAVLLRMISQDVIHSLSLPAFRIKQDVFPGRYTSTWFEATKVGKYHLFCTEYCGTDHSVMGGHIYVLEPQEYEKFLATGAMMSDQMTAEELYKRGSMGTVAMPTMGAKPKTPVEEGMAHFEYFTCVTCHRAGSGQLGPQLDGIYGTKVKLADGSEVTVDDNYIRESILNPNAKVVAGFAPVMPTFQGRISEEQIQQLIAYIKSLGRKK